MSGIGTGYDLSVSSYSPDGKVFQTEYAQKAVDNSGTVIGIKCKDGIVLACEKEVTSKMMVKGSNKRIFNVSKHAGVAVAGVLPDGRMVVNEAFDEAEQYQGFYGSQIPGNVLSERLASHMHKFNLFGYYRPYGATLFLAVATKKKPELYMIETSGVAHKFFGAAAGKGRQSARTEIEKLKLGEISVEQGVKDVVRILFSVHEEEKDMEVEVSWICEESGWEHCRVPAEIVSEAERLAKEALDDDMDDD